MNIDSVIKFLAESMEHAVTIDELCWNLAKNCISKLNFEDCIIYIYDDKKNKLIQKAAFGPKNPSGKIIINPIVIPLGKGIVGSVALHGLTELINDTSKDPRYIVDDKRRYSELTVPIKIGGKVIGVIDSEHSSKNFFTSQHLNVLSVISSFLGNKVMEISEQHKLSHEPSSTKEKIKLISEQESDYLILNTQSRTYKLHKNDILRAEADGNYCVIYTAGNLKIMTAKTLKSLEKEIDSTAFLRPHKSHLVNINYIDECVNNELILSDKTSITISVRKQSIIKRSLLEK